MPEQHNVEYKQSWHDEYLKEICGFADAQGGVLYIGRNDTGHIVGFADYKSLMDDIPNKIKNNLGITSEVNLLQEQGNYFIEVIVHPYTVPISLRGRYYYRSGSVKQELTGASLNEFLLKRSGYTWDEVPEASATFDDIDEKTVVSVAKDDITLKKELNSRQRNAIEYVKENGKITNKEYQEINECSHRTATRDLIDLVQKDLLQSNDSKGAGVFYVLIEP